MKDPDIIILEAYRTILRRRLRRHRIRKLRSAVITIASLMLYLLPFAAAIIVPNWFHLSFSNGTHDDLWYSDENSTAETWSVIAWFVTTILCVALAQLLPDPDKD